MISPADSFRIWEDTRIPNHRFQVSVNALAYAPLLISHRKQLFFSLSLIVSGYTPRWGFAVALLQSGLPKRSLMDWGPHATFTTGKAR